MEQSTPLTDYLCKCGHPMRVHNRNAGNCWICLGKAWNAAMVCSKFTPDNLTMLEMKYDERAK